MVPYKRPVTVLCMLGQADQAAADAATERSNAQRLEAERALLDRQNKELRAKLDETESQNKARAKASQQAFDSKIAGLEEQLEAEMRSVLVKLRCTSQNVCVCVRVRQVCSFSLIFINLYSLINLKFQINGVNNSNNNNKNLCGRDGRTICGPQCVPKSTCVSL